MMNKKKYEPNLLLRVQFQISPSYLVLRYFSKEVSNKIIL